MFKSFENCGFQMTFTNGYTLSVVFGVFNYCEKRGRGNIGCEAAEPVWELKDAEIAIFDPNREFVKLTDYDDVKGWVSADTVGHLAGYLAAAKGDALDAVEIQAFLAWKESVHLCK